MAKVLRLNPVLTAAGNTDTFAIGVPNCGTFFPWQISKVNIPTTAMPRISVKVCLFISNSLLADRGSQKWPTTTAMSICSLRRLNTLKSVNTLFILMWNFHRQVGCYWQLYWNKWWSMMWIRGSLNPSSLVTYPGFQISFLRKHLVLIQQCFVTQMHNGYDF